MSVTPQSQRAHDLEESLYKTDYPSIKTIWVERERVNEIALRLNLPVKVQNA